MVLLKRVYFNKQLIKKLSSHSVISSKAKPIDIPKISLQEFLWQNVEKYSNKIAVSSFETKRSYTYSELYKKSLAINHFLNKFFKNKKHGTVGIILPNVPEFPIAMMGAIQAGLKVTTVNPNYTHDEIKRQFDDANSEIVFTSTEMVPLVKQATNVPIVEISNNKSTVSGTINFHEIASGEISPPTSNVSCEDIMLLPYSSGTTGLPKGVQLSHFNIVANLCQLTSPEFSLIEKSEGNDQDLVPAVLPLFHIYGLVVVMLQALVQGAHLVTMSTFNSNSFIELLKNYRVDTLYGIPLIVNMVNNNPNIKEQDLLGMRYLMSGAAPLGALDVERFREKTSDQVCIIQGYGMTETSPVTLVQTKRLDNGIKTGGSGLLLPNTQAKILSTEGFSSEDKMLGELAIKGPQVMKGYYKNPEANSEIYLDHDWIKTGDIAYCDEDEHFYITDRCKELIKVKGFQVAPAEIEALLRNHPHVEDAGVVGVPHAVLGEAPKAFIVAKAGCSVQPQQLDEYVASKLAKHKHLAGGIAFVDSIPKSASGKILRRELKKF